MKVETVLECRRVPKRRLCGEGKIASLSNTDKLSVINAWKSQGDFLGNATIRQKFSSYWDDIIINSNAQFENLLTTKNDWFDDIFKNDID